MAEKRSWFASVMRAFDDRDSYSTDDTPMAGFRTESQIIVEEAPTEETHVLRLMDRDTLINGTFLYGTIADRPEAGNTPRCYLATDEVIIYFDNGDTWDVVADTNAEATFDSGAIADRPLSATYGSFYYASDTAVMYRYFTAWVAVPQINGILICTLATRPDPGQFGRFAWTGDRNILAFDNTIEWFVLTGTFYGDIADRPAPDQPTTWFYAEDEERLYFCDGTQWIAVASSSDLSTPDPLTVNTLNANVAANLADTEIATLSVTGEADFDGEVKGQRYSLTFCSPNGITSVNSVPEALETVPGLATDFVMPKPGSVVAVSIKYDISAASAGVGTLEVSKNAGSSTWSTTLSVATTGTERVAKNSQARDAQTFVADDRIRVNFKCTTADNATIENYSVLVLVVFDT